MLAVMYTFGLELFFDFAGYSMFALAISKFLKSLDKKGLLKLIGLRIPIKFEMAKANIE